MKRIISITFLFVFLLAFTVFSSAQTGISKTYSFYKINTPGTIPVDENGRPMGKTHDTVHIIYFETAKGAKPKLNAIVIDGNYYKPILTKVITNKAEPGALLKTNDTIRIKTKASNQLWKVETGGEMGKPATSKFKKNLIYLLVEYKGRKATQIIKEHKELVPDLNY